MIESPPPMPVDNAVVLVGRVITLLHELIEEGNDPGAIAGMIIGMGIGMYADGGCAKADVENTVATILDGVFARGTA